MRKANSDKAAAEKAAEDEKNYYPSLGEASAPKATAKKGNANSNLQPLGAPIPKKKDKKKKEVLHLFG